MRGFVYCAAVFQLKTKITAQAVTFGVNGKTNLSRRFAECLDALGAERLLDQSTVFHDLDLLQIRFEGAVGCAQGERALVTKGGCFTAGITLSHVGNPFKYDDADNAFFFKGTGFYHTTQPYSS